MAHNLYRGFAIQNTFMSTAIIGRMVLQRHYPLSAILLTSLSIFAQLPTLRWNIFVTKALLALWVIPNSFSRFCSQNDYLNSKLMLRWDGHFKGRIFQVTLFCSSLFFSLHFAVSQRKHLNSSCFTFLTESPLQLTDLLWNGACEVEVVTCEQKQWSDNFSEAIR